MFAQVACLKCGKPFQVGREKLGQGVPCPWCGQTTDAVPAAVEVHPLPADSSDLTPRPPLRTGEGESAAPPKRRPRLLPLVAYAVLLLVVAAAVFVLLRYQGGYVPDVALAEFVAPDGSCRAVLPGAAREGPVAGDEFLPAGRRFAASSWLTRAGGEVGWFDLPAEEVKLLREEDLFRHLRDRRAKELDAAVTAEGVVRVDSSTGAEVRFTRGDVRHVDRYLLAKGGPNPRVYWVSVGGPNLDPDSAVAQRVIGSLRLTRP